jgi:hypothetical protein
MHGPINVKSPNNTSKWQMGFNSAFKGLILILRRMYCDGIHVTIFRGRDCGGILMLILEGQEDKEEDVRSYWMTLRKGEDTLI